MNKTRKITALVCLIALALTAVLALTACSPAEYYNIKAGVVYKFGEQTLTVEIDSNSEDKTTFLNTISASDITFGDKAKGRTAKSVTFVSDTTIKVVVEGVVEAKATGEYGKVTISANAMANKAISHCYVNVSTPQIKVTTASSSTNPSRHSSTLALDAGYFTQANITLDNISITNGTGTLTATYNQDGTVSLKVTDFVASSTDTHPVVKFADNTNTIGSSFSVTVGVLNFFDFDHEITSIS